MELNKYSKTITQDETQPAAQAMLVRDRFDRRRFKERRRLELFRMGYEGNTCNMHLNDLAKDVKAGVWKEPI